MNGLEIVEKAVMDVMNSEPVKMAVQALVKEATAELESRVKELEDAHAETAARVDAVEAVPTVAKSLEKAGS